jgi:hypothetical protein
MSGMVAERGRRRQTGMYVGMDSSPPTELRIQAQKKPGPKTGLCLLRVACGFACRTDAISAAWRWCGPARQRCSVRQRAAPCRQRRR